MLTAPDMKVTGKMISNMEKVKKHGKMEVNTTDTMLTQRKKAWECTNGLMAINILENGKIMPFMDKVSTSGMMAEYIVETGKTI